MNASNVAHFTLVFGAKLSRFAVTHKFAFCGELTLTNLRRACPGRLTLTSTSVSEFTMKEGEVSIELGISDVVDRYGVTARALRFYETKGLLTPQRRGRARVYAAGDLSRIDFIIRARRLGFSLDEIKDMFDAAEVVGSEDRGSEDRGSEDCGSEDCGVAGGLDDIDAVRACRIRMGERVAALEILQGDIDVLLRELSARTKALDTALSDVGASLDEGHDLRARAAAFQRLGQSWVWSDASP